MKDQTAKKPPQALTRFGRQARASDTFQGLKLMRKAVKLIRMFPHYSDVVVSVARKVCLRPSSSCAHTCLRLLLLFLLLLLIPPSQNPGT